MSPAGDAPASAAPQSVVRSNLRWIVTGIAVGLLVVINASIASSPGLERSPTSYGKSPIGFGAAYDVLTESRLTVSRWRRPYTELPSRRTLWLLAPSTLAAQVPRAVPTRSSEPEDAGRLREVAGLLTWVERGGTAVVFGDGSTDWEALGLGDISTDPDDDAVQRTSGRSARAMQASALRHFTGEPSEEVETLWTLGESPFVLRRTVGAGHVVAIADAQFLSNGELDRGEHAALMIDLVRAFGVPVFDEMCHGLAESPSLMQALRVGRAVLLALGLGLFACIWLWSLRLLPATTRRTVGGIEPGLTAFVESLALLYSRQAPRHRAAIVRAYAQGVRHRMQRLGSRAAAGAGLAAEGERNLQSAAQELERAFAAAGGSRARGHKRLRNPQPWT